MLDSCVLIGFIQHAHGVHARPVFGTRLGQALIRNSARPWQHPLAMLRGEDVFLQGFGALQDAEVRRVCAKSVGMTCACDPSFQTSGMLICSCGL